MEEITSETIKEYFPRVVSWVTGMEKDILKGGQSLFLITPWPIAIAIAAPLAGPLAERYSAGLLGGIGLLLFAAEVGMLAFLPAHPVTLDVVRLTALSGAGFGLFQFT
jgi:MFS family permease